MRTPRWLLPTLLIVIVALGVTIIAQWSAGLPRLSKSYPISIDTTSDAFTTPDPRVSPIRKDGTRFSLLLSISPAPWPTEARDIYLAASKGFAVRVTASRNGNATQFEIVGIDRDGYLIIPVKSEKSAQDLIEALGLQMNSLR